MKKLLAVICIILATVLVCSTLQSCAGGKRGKYDCPKI